VDLNFLLSARLISLSDKGAFQVLETHFVLCCKISFQTTSIMNSSFGGEANWPKRKIVVIMMLTTWFVVWKQQSSPSSSKSGCKFLVHSHMQAIYLKELNNVHYLHSIITSHHAHRDIVLRMYCIFMQSSIVVVVFR